MGRWGDGFFEGDQDLDMADDLSHIASCELMLIGVPAEESGIDMYPCRTLEETRQYLDNATFDVVFDSLKGKKCNHHFIVVFAALCMQIGVTITEARMNYLRRIYRRSGIWGRTVQQFKDALDGYVNGIPWDFGSKGLLETVNDLHVQSIYQNASQIAKDSVEDASAEVKDKKGGKMKSGPKHEHTDVEAEAPKGKIKAAKEKVNEWLEDTSQDEREGFPKTKRVKLTSTE